MLGVKLRSPFYKKISIPLSKFLGVLSNFYSDLLYCTVENSGFEFCKMAQYLDKVTTAMPINWLRYKMCMCSAIFTFRKLDWYTGKNITTVRLVFFMLASSDC